MYRSIVVEHRIKAVYVDSQKAEHPIRVGIVSDMDRVQGEMLNNIRCEKDTLAIETVAKYNYRVGEHVKVLGGTYIIDNVVIKRSEFNAHLVGLLKQDNFLVYYIRLLGVSDDKK